MKLSSFCRVMTLPRLGGAFSGTTRCMQVLYRKALQMKALSESVIGVGYRIEKRGDD